MVLKALIRNVFEAITAILMMAMVVATLTQVINRYAIYASLDWIEEIARLDLIYLTFFGSIVAAQRHDHLVIDTVARLLPRLLYHWVRIIVDLMTLGVFATVVWVGIPLLSESWVILSPALGWPISFFYFPVIFACLVLSIYTANDVLVAIRSTGSGSEVRP